MTNLQTRCQALGAIIERLWKVLFTSWADDFISLHHTTHRQMARQSVSMVCWSSTSYIMSRPSKTIR